MRLAVLLALAPTVALAESAGWTDPDLDLVCHGRGAHDKVSIGPMLAFSGGRSAQGLAVSTQRVDADNTVRVRLKRDETAVRVPRELFAGKLHKSAPGGWLKLSDVAVTPAEITGRISLFITSRPRLRIDRDTGDIEIHGSNAFSFSGNCERAPAEAAAKF